MGVDLWKDDLDLAREVVRKGLAALTIPGNVMTRFGDLSVFSEREAQEMESFRGRIEEYYSELEKAKRPLCLGVFGPPGSGKSFAVRELLKGRAIRLINLSQLQGPGDLSTALAEGARWSAGQVPVVFFDEFDSQLDGAPLGWLQWLLAPMQDGVVFDHGNAVDLKRAVFVFAGGTADTFEEFPDAHEGYFRGAKGPDFVSRLRGHLNIGGANEWPYRRLRRAILLRSYLEKHAGGLLDGDGKLIPGTRMEDDLIDRVLAVGRYRHGARSMEAIVEMSKRSDLQRFTETDLPPLPVRSNHVDLGPLGDRVIALSAGGHGKDFDEKLHEVWPLVATRLLEAGSGLVYGGDLRKNGFTELLIKANESLPVPLVPDEKKEEGGIDLLERPRSARVTWVIRPKKEEGEPRDRIDVRRMPALSDEEIAELERCSPQWHERLEAALSLFRMRTLITRCADAHLVFGGKTSGSSGRFPGIAEEVMLSLAAGRAVYLCGGFGGAAQEVGQVLGLGAPWIVAPACLQLDHHGPDAAQLETAISDKDKGCGLYFQLPHRSDLPLTYTELVTFLRSHAIEGPGWPDNGLTAEENRILFRTRDAGVIVRLVTRGLRRRRQPPPAPRHA